MIDLDKAKVHLRVDGTHDDVDISDKLQASILYAQEYLQRKIYSTQEALDESLDLEGIVTNSLIEAAILLVLGQLYAYRETAAGGPLSALPLTAKALLDPYRIKQGV